jgi:hypothetical protein
MKPVLLSQSDLKLGVIASMAVSPDHTKIRKIVEAARVRRCSGAGEKEEERSIQTEAIIYSPLPLCPPASLQSLRCLLFSLT